MPKLQEIAEKRSTSMFRRKAVLLGIAAIFACMVFGLRMQAQCKNSDDWLIIFSSSSNTLSGTVKNCGPDLFCRTTRITPVADSSASAFDNKDATNYPNVLSLDNVYQVVYGVKVYDVSNADNSTSTRDCLFNYGNADVYTGAGNLLQGLVTWTSNDDLFSCTQYGEVPDNDQGILECSSSQKIHGLTINGVTVPIGSHRGRVSFPVSGTIKDPDCASGTETFNGSLKLQDSSVHGSKTDNITVSLTGMHLTGQATCTTSDLVSLFTTQYDLRVGGHSNQAQLDRKEPGLKMKIHALQFASELEQ